MAEAPYGQLSQAELILEEIRDTAAREHATLAQLLTSQQIQTSIMTDAVISDKEGSKYEREQQGQEIEYSRLQQWIQEKELKMLSPGIISPSGMASEETNEKATEYLKDVKETAESTLKAQLKEWRKNATNYIEDKARFSNFQGAVKNDMNLMMGKFQLLTQLPGVTSILTGMKMILAQIFLFFIKKFPGFFKPFIWLINKFRDEENQIEYGADRKKRETKEKREAFMKSKPVEGDFESAKEFKDATKDWEKKKKKMEEGEAAASGYWGGTKERFTRMGLYLKSTFGAMYNTIKGIGTTFVTWVQKIFHGPFGLGTFLKRTFTLIKDTWSKTILPAMSNFYEMSGLKAAVEFMITSFADAAQAIWKMVKKFVATLANFFIQVYLFIAEMVSAIVAFIAANALILSVIIILAVIAYFMWKNWTAITKWWDNMKASWNYAVDKMKLWWQSVKNMISDIGEDIGYAVKWLLTKIQLAVWKLANWVIDQANKVIPFDAIKIQKFDTSELEAEVSGIGKARALQQTGRSERDAALDASREGLLYAEINRQLVQMLEGKPPAGAPSPVITNVHNETSSRTHYTGVGGARDTFMKSMNTSVR